jgi:hypothetical protein
VNLMSEPSPQSDRILYCRCAHAKVIETEVKDQVLEGLCDSGCHFETASDLCQMSASKDPALQRIAATPGVRIVACYPRAVRWLFNGAGQPLPDDVEILNMRTDEPDAILNALLNTEKAEPRS